ncbi:MAG TPA: flagellar export protein FliJ [Verrucomicrobiae bacterium]
MKPFRFSLAALRTLRERQEKSAQEKLASTMIGRQRAAEALNALDRELTAARLDWQQHAAAGCAAAQLAQQQMHCAWLDTRCRQAEQALSNAERAVQSARNELVHAQRERELLERLYERQKIAFDRALSLAEQKELDDLVSGRFGLNTLRQLA